MNNYFMINGQLYNSKEEHQISINCDGFNYGYGIFETILIKDGEPICFKEHFSRIKRDASQINLKFDYIYEEVYNWVKKLIEANGCNLRDKIALKMMVYKSMDKSDMVLKFRPYPYVDEDFQKGYRLGVSQLKRHSTNPTYRLKSMNYLNNILEKGALVGLDEMIHLNEKNHVTECIFSNIFLVKNEEIYTPLVEDGLLAGIVRKKIIDISREIGYYVHESHITEKDIEAADEVFITNSLLEIMTISAFKGIKLNNDCREITHKIKSALEKSV